MKDLKTFFLIFDVRKLMCSLCSGAAYTWALVVFVDCLCSHHIGNDPISQCNTLSKKGYDEKN